MINIDVLEGELKKNNIENGYIFCGLDEELIKSSIDPIIKKVVDKDFLDLNFIKLDGLTTTFDEIENACETLPFFGEKKVVLVYRANFLKDKPDKDGAKTYTELLKYIKDLPKHTVLIMYYLFIIGSYDRRCVQPLAYFLVCTICLAAILFVSGARMAASIVILPFSTAPMPRAAASRRSSESRVFLIASRHRS